MYDRLTSLAKDPSRARRARFLMRLTELMSRAGSDLPSELNATFCSIVLEVLPTIAGDEQAAIANRLADADHAPTQLIEALAAWPINVAAPLLRRSALLDDEALVALAAVAPNDHLLAMAARVRISEQVSDALMAHGNRLVVKALAQNCGARFSARGLSRLVDEASAISRHEARGLVLSFHLIDRKKPQRDPLDGPGIVLPFPRGPAAVADPFKPAVEAGAETPIAAVIATLASGDRMLEVAILLAEAAGLPTDRVSRLIARPDPAPLMVFCKAAGVATKAFALIVAIHGRCFGRSSAEVFQMVKRYAALRPDDARRALRFLKLDQGSSVASEWTPFN